MSAALDSDTIGWLLTAALLVVVLLALLGAAMSRAVDQRRAREEAAAERDKFGTLPPRDTGDREIGGWWR